jgi:predicted nucleic acid-binding protein
VIVGDSSAVVPALLWWHEDHEASLGALRSSESLIAHVALEVYSVLTRLPDDMRTDAATAQGMLDAHFPGPFLALTARQQRTFAASLPDLKVTGGSVYDALVGATARQAGATLLTRDRRALPTYAAIGVDVELF